jgi:hypothetical protein
VKGGADPGELLERVERSTTHVWWLSRRRVCDSAASLTTPGARQVAPRGGRHALHKRRLEIVGEAAARLSPELRDRHPDVPCRDNIGMRQILAHGYSRSTSPQQQRAPSAGAARINDGR